MGENERSFIQFVNSPSERDVAGSGASSHGNAEHAGSVHDHRPGECRQLPIVDDHQGGVLPLLCEFDEHVPRVFIKILVRDAAEERREAHPVVLINACGGAADGIDARQLGGRPA